MPPKFQPGFDSRRAVAAASSRAGRPIGSKALALKVRQVFSKDAAEILERIRMLALSGDPQAAAAAATLLAACISSHGNDAIAGGG